MSELSKSEMFPKITDKGLDQLRERIGVPIENTLEPWCHEATRDNIRHYAHGIGDDNPLWCDPDYAAKTKHGALSRCPRSCLPPTASFPVMSAAYRACMRCGPAPTGHGIATSSATRRCAPRRR
ncbi:MAG: hypothetical protein R3D67_13945 [Hyphomicrobiaceae bacterium]